MARSVKLTIKPLYQRNMYPKPCFFLLPVCIVGKLGIPPPQQTNLPPILHVRKCWCAFLKAAACSFESSPSDRLQLSGVKQMFHVGGPVVIHQPALPRRGGIQIPTKSGDHFKRHHPQSSNTDLSSSNGHMNHMGQLREMHSRSQVSSDWPRQVGKSGSWFQRRTRWISFAPRWFCCNQRETQQLVSNTRL